jgi:hypothetical protein
MPQIECPDEFAARVQAFLAGTGRAEQADRAAVPLAS